MPDLLGKRRYRSIARARLVAMFVLRKRFGMSHAEVGAWFGHRDHTGSIHAVQAVTANPELLAVATRWLGPGVAATSVQGAASVVVDGYRVA